MAKNITIKEGRTTQTANNVSQIRVTDAGSGSTENWVPEDDVNLGILTINANGTYRASDDGFYGYSKVIVNTPTGTASKTVVTDSEDHITESKSIRITEGSSVKTFEDIKRLKVKNTNNTLSNWVAEDGVQLMRKTVTEAGTYEAEDDDYYGFSEVVVNIPEPPTPPEPQYDLSIYEGAHLYPNPFNFGIWEANEPLVWRLSPTYDQQGHIVDYNLGSVSFSTDVKVTSFLNDLGDGPVLFDGTVWTDYAGMMLFASASPFVATITYPSGTVVTENAQALQMNGQTVYVFAREDTLRKVSGHTFPVYQLVDGSPYDYSSDTFNYQHYWSHIPPEWNGTPYAPGMSYTIDDTTLLAKIAYTLVYVLE